MKIAEILERCISDTIKPVAVAVGGRILVELPDHVQWLNELLAGIEGFYTFLIFTITFTYITTKTILTILRIKTEKRKWEND